MRIAAFPPLRIQWNRVMSVVNKETPPAPPIVHTPPLASEEPPRKKRRRAGNKTQFVKPENRNADLFTKEDWIIDGPYRRVNPYYYTYYTWAKERWHGVTLLDVFCSEFRDREPAYYKAAIARGSVNVNGKMATEDYRIQNGDCVSHTLHRHEPPVSSRPIKIIHHDEETGLLIIDKPAGIPVHAAGRYHQNSIVTILRLEHGFKDASPCNRLDRLTSGVMILGLNKIITAAMALQLTQRTVWKEYYCRVVGKFPEGEITVDEPIITVSPKHGLNRLRKDGKPSKTVFHNLFYDEQRDQSVVLAKPLTGRTHQIRVHLQFLGHPIANDPIYANPEIFIVPEDAMDATDEEIIRRLDSIGKSVAAKTLADTSVPASAETNITLVHGLENPENKEMWSGEICDVCGTQLYLDPAPGELEIWLHAWKYSGTSAPESEGEEGKVWTFQSEPPEWGCEEWQGPPRYQRLSDKIVEVDAGPK